jgi:hypothetical protein
MNNWKKILNELSYRVSTGIPDLTNEQHLMKLWDILKEHNWNIDARVELLKNLTEQTEKKLTKKQVRDLLTSHKDLEKADSDSNVKVYGDISDNEMTAIIKSKFKGLESAVLKVAAGASTNPSRRDPLFTWIADGFEYQVNLASTKVTGRGTSQTKDQELSWLLFLSGLQYGADPNDKDGFISTLISNSAVYNKVGITEQEALHLGAYLENNDDWYKSHQSQCQKFTGLVSNKQPKKYLKDDSKLPINVLAKKLYEKEYGKRLQLDKWNPADVWLEYNSSIPNFETLAELNNWLIDSLHNGSGIIGVSLKKGSGKVGIVNDYKRKEYKLSSLDIKYGGFLTQGVTFNYKGKNLDGLGLHFRIFQAKANETIRGEGTAKGAEAVQGKVAMEVADDFIPGTLSKVSKVRGISVIRNKKTKQWELTRDGKSKYKLAKDAYSKIKQRNFGRGKGDWKKAFSNERNLLDQLNNDPNIKKMSDSAVQANLSARFQSVVFGSLVDNLSNQKKSDLMLGMLKYGKSESDWSSAHYKAQ